MDIVNSVIKCKECSGLLEKPVLLLCGSSVCYKHLENLQNVTFFCKSCDDDHVIEENSLVVNKPLEILIEANLLNLNLGVEYKAAFDLCNKFDQTIKDMETLKSDPNYFIKQTIDRLKNKTELIREEYKLKIDEKADKIIQQLDDYEKECKSKLDSFQFEPTIAEITEKLTKIKGNLEEWQTTLKNFGSKENDWITIKQNCNESNINLIKETWDFKRQLLDNKITDYFTIVLNFQEIKITSDNKLDEEMQEYEDILENVDIKNSKIIDDAKRQQLLTLCNISSDKRWRLIYRGSEHGLNAESFHSKCDNIPNTLTIIKSTSGYIFGGFTSQAWDQSGIYKNDPSAYLFSLTNPQNQPQKLMTQNPSYAIYCHASCGPAFGTNGYDLCISYSSNSSNLGNAYPHRYNHNYNYNYGNISSLTESQYFHISDIDIYQLV